MNTTELIKKVRKIEIKTRGLSNQVFSGQYNSAFKGQGMSFSEVREYQFGDDIRAIDWNVTARLNRPYIKVFEEEREMTVMVMVDVSASGLFGTNIQLKQEMAVEICATLAFSAIANNDKVGVIFFSDQIEKFIPPKKGKQHILMIVRELINFNPVSKKTDVSGAIKFFTQVIKKRSTAFLISDFLSDEFEKPLNIANRKHDVIAIHLSDKAESTLPDLGLIPFFDPESETTSWINTSDKIWRKQYSEFQKIRKEKLTTVFRKCGVDAVEMNTDEDFVRPLLNLFKQRGSKR